MKLGVDEATYEQARHGEAVSIARCLVATPSVNPVLSPDGEGEERIAMRAAAFLDEWGFDTAVLEVAEGRFNVVARLKGAGPGRSLLLNGHLDTVGVTGMTHSPFDPVVKDGRLYGRGSCDMKGGVAAALSAAASLADGGLGTGALTVALTADEEHASLGMAALVDGGIRADAAVVCEPTGLAVMPAHKGFLWIDLSFRGRAAHGSRPEKGVDAVRHAGLYLAELEAYEVALRSRPAHALLGQPSFHVGTIEGGEAPSIYPAECSLTLEMRTLPGETPEDVEAELRRHLQELRGRVPELDVTLARGLARPGTEVSTDSPLVRGLLESCRARKVKPRVEGMTAWVDAAFLNEAGVPAVCFGPGDIAQAHAAEEWCDVGEIESCARILEDFARGFLSDG